MKRVCLVTETKYEVNPYSEILEATEEKWKVERAFSRCREHTECQVFRTKNLTTQRIWNTKTGELLPKTILFT